MDSPTTEQPKQSYKDFSLEPADEGLMKHLRPGHSTILKMTGRYQDIARLLGIADGTAKSRMHRARAALVELRNRREVCP